MFRKRFFKSQQCIFIGLLFSALSPAYPSSAQPEDPIRIKNVPALINYVKGSDKFNRQQALLKLQVMGAEAKAAVPVLAETVSDPDEDIRALAFDALRSMQESAVGALPTLIKVIEGSNTDDRRHAIEVLSRMGEAARPAMPVLRKAAQDPDFMVSDDAKEVLELLGEKQADSTDGGDNSSGGPDISPKPAVPANPASKARSKPVATTAVPEKYKDLESNLVAKMEKMKPAFAAVRQGEQDAARKLFNAEITDDPSAAANAPAFAGLGMSYIISRDFRNAEASFIKALAVLPLRDYHVIKSANMEALVNIAYSGLLIAHLNEDKLEAAINDERQLAKYNKARAEEAFLFCGTVYGCLGRFEEGVREMDAALKLTPTNATALKMKKMFVNAETDKTLAAELNKIMREKLEDRIAKGNANITLEKLNQYDPDKKKN